LTCFRAITEPRGRGKVGVRRVESLQRSGKARRSGEGSLGTRLGGGRERGIGKRYYSFLGRAGKGGGGTLSKRTKIKFQVKIIKSPCAIH